MKRQQLCVVFRATEAGECISRHLNTIDEILDRALRLDRDRNGECRLLLPRDADEGVAQGIADQLNRIMDEHGRPVLEAELAFMSLSQATVFEAQA